MKCFYCNNPGIHPCINPLILVCNIHFFKDYSDKPVDAGEILEFTLEETESLLLRIQRRIKILDSIQEIILNTSLKQIRFIENYSKSAYSRYELEKLELLRLMMRKHFLKADQLLLSQIKTKDLKFSTLKHLDKIHKVKKFFDQNFTKEEPAKEAKQASQLSQFLHFHNGGFWGGVVTQDEKFLITAGIDSTLKVWSLEKKDFCFTLEGHRAQVRCLALNQETNVVVSGSYDRTLRFWNLNLRKETGRLVGHSSAVYSVCLIPDEDLIVSGSKALEIILWKCQSQTMIKRIKTTYLPQSIVFNSFDRTLLVTSSNLILINDKDLTTENWRLAAHSAQITFLLLLSESNTLASASHDTSVRVWNLNSFSLMSTLIGHSKAVWSLSTNLPEDLLVSGSLDLTVRVWSLISLRILNVFNTNQDHVYCVLTFKHFVLSLSRDSLVTVWDLNKNLLSCVLKQRAYRPETLNFVLDSELAAYVSGTKVVIWDLVLNKEQMLLIGHKYLVISLELSSCGKYILTSSIDKSLILWELNQGRQLRTYPQASAVFSLSFSSDSLNFLGGCQDGSIHWFDMQKELWSLKRHDQEVTSLTLARSKNFGVSGSVDKTVIIWDLLQKKMKYRLSSHQEAVWKVILSDDERFLMSGDLYFEVFVWNLQTGQREEVLKREKDAKKWIRRYPGAAEKLKFLLFS